MVFLPRTELEDCYEDEGTSACKRSLEDRNRKRDGSDQSAPVRPQTKSGQMEEYYQYEGYFHSVAWDRCYRPRSSLKL